jgi:hypothetical protein
MSITGNIYVVRKYMRHFMRQTHIIRQSSLKGQKYK